MEHQVIEELLDSLAERYIPVGRHKSLYVNSREMWKDIMVTLIESESISPRLSILSKCAISWESILIQKISIQN